jgi:hypothetical protein
MEPTRMSQPTNDDLTALAVSAALMAIREGDHRKLKVELTFEAERDHQGIRVSKIALGYAQPSKPA